MRKRRILLAEIMARMEDTRLRGAGFVGGGKKK